mgnify:CR=1 FL=1
MKYIAKIAIVLFTFWLAIPTIAQTPKKEVRAFWLSTVWRLTWPKTTVISNTGNAQEIQEQKDELIMLLDSVKAANANTVYFQVRGRCDAMYKSSYEPWSSDLVATRGMDPGYDPLLFAVEEAHKRGIEIHAWFNPYRYESVLHQWDGTPQNYRESHPEWLLDYSDGSILNPAMPEVRDHITAIIQEVVQNYDIDGVVFDDYFYMSGTTDDMDDELYQQSNPDNLSRADWRRQNVNKLIAQVYRMIQSEKPYVRFGISPAGVWCTDATIAERYPGRFRLGVRRYLLRSYGMDTRTLYRLHIAANLLDDRIEQRLHAYRRMVEPNRKAIRLSFLFEPFGIRFELGQNAIKIRKNDNRDTIVRSKRRKSFFQSALSHRTENSRRKRIHRRWRNRFVQRLRTGQSN